MHTDLAAALTRGADRPVTRVDRIILTFVILLSLAVCLPVAVAVKRISPDGVLYNDIAEHLLSGQGFSQDVRDAPIIVPPLYPLLLAGIYGLFGEGNTVAVLVVQSILLSAASGLCFLIGRRLFGRVVGAIAGLLFAAYPIAIYWNGYVLTETLYVVLVLWFMWEACRLLKERPTVLDAVVVGLVWGLGCLARPHLLFFGPCLILWAAWLHRGRGVKLSLISMAMMIATIAPWVAYLYVQFGMLVPVASHGSLQLWLGNNPYVDFSNRFDLPSDAPAFWEAWARILALPFKDQGAAYQREAVQFIVANPLQFVGNTLRKALFLWRGLRSSEQTLGQLIGWLGGAPSWVLSLVRVPVQIVDCAYLALFPLGVLISFFCSLRRHHVLLWLLIYLTAFTSIGIIAPVGRYRLPMMPFVVIYVALVIYVAGRVGAWLWQRASRWRTSCHRTAGRT